MARIRTIKPKFWDDIKLSRISRDARLLFIGVWNFADDCGVFVAENSWIKSKVFPYDEISNNLLEKWVQELVQFKFIEPVKYNSENFYHIRTFNNHQRIDKPNNDDIFIPKALLINILYQSKNNPRSIQEEYNINPISIQGGKDSKGEERKGIGEEGESAINSGFENDFFIVPEMMKIWKKINPNYPDDKEKDYTALRKISEFICSQEKIKLDTSKKTHEKVLPAFEFIAKFSNEDSFFKNYSLSQIDRHIQSIITSIQNGNSKKSKQPTGGQVSTASAFDAIDSHFS